MAAGRESGWFWRCFGVAVARPVNAERGSATAKPVTFGGSGAEARQCIELAQNRSISGVRGDERFAVGRLLLAAVLAKNPPMPKAGLC